MHNVRIILSRENKTSASHISSQLINFIEGLIKNFLDDSGIF